VELAKRENPDRQVSPGRHNQTKGGSRVG
jgi:hypothetical protein